MNVEEKNQDYNTIPHIHAKTHTKSRPESRAASQLSNKQTTAKSDRCIARILLHTDNPYNQCHCSNPDEHRGAAGWICVDRPRS